MRELFLIGMIAFCSIISCLAAAQTQQHSQAKTNCEQAYPTALFAATQAVDWFGKSAMAKDATEKLHARKYPKLTPQERTQTAGQMEAARFEHQTGVDRRGQGNTDYQKALIQQQFGYDAWLAGDFASAAGWYDSARSLFNSASYLYQGAVASHGKALSVYGGVQAFLNSR